MVTNLSTWSRIQFDVIDSMGDGGFFKTGLPIYSQGFVEPYLLSGWRRLGTKELSSALGFELWALSFETLACRELRKLELTKHNLLTHHNSHFLDVFQTVNERGKKRKIGADV